MIKINKIKIDINTSEGLFGSYNEFKSGLNIIRGDNTSGKSSLFQAIIYCLGFEELIGGRDEKTMQSVLKDQVEYPKNKFYDVIQSFITIEIENGNNDKVTVRRGVASNTGRSSKLLDVYFGSKIDFPNSNFEHKPMYVHDGGAATDEMYGFHMFLEEFIGISLPKVLSNKGDLRKLYLQQVASSHIIEQKTGWSDFFATMPHYGLQNKEARVIEFLLDLDVYENKKQKQKLSIDKKIVENKWLTVHNRFVRLAEKGGGKLVGISDNIEIINNKNEINIFLSHEGSDYAISDFINVLIDDLDRIEVNEINPISKNIDKNEIELDSLSKELNTITLNIDMISTELIFDIDKFNSYEEQKELLKEDLKKNKGASKVKKLGADFNLEISKDKCPTCHQIIVDSLLPEQVDQIPMRIDENIFYLESQLKMIIAYMSGVKNTILGKEKKIKLLREKQSEIRLHIRNLKKELISDERIPSIVEIEKRLNLKKKIEFYVKYLDDFNLLVEEAILVSKEWGKIIANIQKLSKNFTSLLDNRKLSTLKDNFKDLLKKFNYTSKSLDLISISDDNYLPVARKPYRDDLFYNIKFDSSASDFIRSIWAYTCSLYKTSQKYSSNHPSLLMFDEPKQQDLSINDFHSFLMELSSYKEGQILLFASFENSDKTFDLATKGIDFNLNYIKEKLIKPYDEKTGYNKVYS